MSWEPDMSQAHDCDGDAAAYALGALTPEESDAFRAHLATCAICQHDLDGFEQVRNVLGMAAPQQQPSKALRKQVLKDVRSDAAGRKVRSRRGAGFSFSRPAFAGGITALLAAVVIAGTQILSSGTSVQVFNATVGNAQLHVASNGYTELIVHHLPQPKGDRIYEVWLQNTHGDLAPTKTLFSVTRSGEGVVGVAGSLKNVKAVMVTEEPAGGSQVPTTKPVIVAPIS